MPPPATEEEKREIIEEMADDLSYQIRAAREAMKLTPARLSLKAGITRAALEKVEKGDIKTPLSFYLMTVWRIDNFASCRGLLSPEGLKERGRSPVNQLMRLCGERMKERREELGLTLAELAKKSGVEHMRVMQMEWGNLWGSFEDYARVFRELGQEKTLKNLLR